jgi:DNA repair protein RecO (recombination protein O)
MPRTTRPLGSRFRTEALLVRKVPFGDADVMVTFFTEARGIVPAVARAARRSARRFPALEPMHLLRVGLEERAGADLSMLSEAVLSRPRLGLTADLDKLEAAGQALRWVRRALPPYTPEPDLWREINGLLDDLDQAPALPETSPPRARLAGTGLRLLSSVGWGLDLERCVRCGRPCEPGASACVDPALGGLVCRACGGARIALREGRLARLQRAILGDNGALDLEDATVAIDLVNAALDAHTS